MIDVIKGDWAAGETKTFMVNGSYFEILECAYPIDVKLMDRVGAVRSDMRQAEASFFSDGLDFATIQITSALAQNVRSFYGDGTAGTRRTAGTVNVVDNGKARTIAGMAFVGQAYQAPVAAQYSYAQLWNPAGSGFNVVLESMLVSSPVAMGVNGGFYNTALTTSAAGISKYAPGAAGVAQRRTQTNAASLVGGAIGLTLQAGLTISIGLREPIVIPPGYGFALQGSALNADLNTTFEWFEEKI